MIQKIEAFTNEVKDLRVCVVGENIQDVFVPILYEGNSMKSNCPVVRLTDEPTLVQQGGAAAIAGHLRDFVKEVKLVCNPEGSIVKTRYYDPFDNRKHMEVNKFDRELFGSISANLEDYDLVLVADFGHGYCDNLQVGGEYCFMTQTNSNNFGFNRISKWKNYRKKMVCLDLREASLQMNHRFSTLNEANLKEIYNYELNTEHLFVTTGKTGSWYTNGKVTDNQQVYRSIIKDTIGAGDTFFAFAGLVAHLNKGAEYHFIPSLAASLSTTWVCNEEQVTKNKLMSHANTIL